MIDLNNLNRKITAYVPDFSLNLVSSYVVISANILTQILLVPFYLKHLSIREFGEIMFAISAINFAGFGVGWITGGIQRQLAQDWAKKSTNSFNDVFAMSKYAAVLYAVLVIFVLILAEQIAKINQSWEFQLPDYSPILALYFVLMLEQNPDRIASSAMNKIYVSNSLDVSRLVLFFLLVVVFLPIYKSSYVIWWSLIASILFQRISYETFWRMQRLNLRWSFFHREIYNKFRFLMRNLALPFGLYGILNVLLISDVFIVGILFGPDKLAEFIFIWKIPEVIAMFLWRIPTIIEPQIMQLSAIDEYEKVKKIYLRGRKAFMVLCFLAAISYFLLGEFIAKIWIADNAPNETMSYAIAACALFFIGLSRWPMAFSASMLQFKSLLRNCAIELALKIILIFTLIEPFGILAPLIATVFTHVLFASYAYHRSVVRYCNAITE